LGAFFIGKIPYFNFLFSNVELKGKLFEFTPTL